MVLLMSFEQLLFIVLLYINFRFNYLIYLY